MERSRRPRRASLVVAAMVGCLGIAVAGPLARTGHAATSPAAPSVHVAGNTLVDQNGQPLRLLGVNPIGTEYQCIGNSGIFDAPNDSTAIAAMVSWHINAVRVLLNEDCWLGINVSGINPAYTGANYQHAISDYVSRLHAAGLVAVIDLHWNAPGAFPAKSQQAMADADHSPAFWASVAGTFVNDPAVVFDLYNEPGDNAPDLTWACWRDGCQQSSVETGTDANGNTTFAHTSWQSAGMQSLVNAVRAAGARQPLILGGLADANDLSQWVANEPADTLNPPQLGASFHVYATSACNTTTCWDAQVAPVAAKVPVVTGELGEYDCAHGFIDQYMQWADQHGISYLGLAWNATDQKFDCAKVPALIANYDGTPSPFGVGLRDHLQQLAQATTTSSSTTLSSTSTSTTGSSTTTSTSSSTTTTVSSTTTTMPSTTTTTQRPRNSVGCQILAREIAAIQGAMDTTPAAPPAIRRAMRMLGRLQKQAAKAHCAAPAGALPALAAGLPASPAAQAVPMPVMPLFPLWFGPWL